MLLLDYLHVRAWVSNEEADYRVSVFAEGGRILRSAAFKLAWSGRLSPNAGISTTHTHTQTTRIDRHPLIHHIRIYTTLTYRNFTQCCSYNACQVYRLWNRRFESPLGHLPGHHICGTSSQFPHLKTTIPPRATTASFQTPQKSMVHQSTYCPRYSLKYKLHKNRTVHIMSFFPSLTLPLPFFYIPAVNQITLHTTRGQSRTFLSPFPTRMYAIKSKKKVSPPPTQHTHKKSCRLCIP